MSDDQRLLRVSIELAATYRALRTWANGGETAVEQLMLLCSKHHTLVHEGGFRIEKDFQDHWTFFRPDGIAVPDCGYHARDMLDDDRADEGLGEQYDNPPRGGLLSAVEKLVNEPTPPRYAHRNRWTSQCAGSGVSA